MKKKIQWKRKMYKKSENKGSECFPNSKYNDDFQIK